LSRQFLLTGFFFMLTKNKIKQLQSLRESKQRQEQGLFLVEGPKWVSEILQSQMNIVELFAVDAWINHHQTLLVNKKFPVIPIDDMELKKISSLITPNAVVAVIRMPRPSLDPDLFQQDLCLMLDGIQDPGNLGTIIRIADWYGVQQIICSTDCVDLYNSKVIQASMGSLLRVKVIYKDLKEFLTSLPSGIPIYGALLDGENIVLEKLSANGIIIIGNESKGISKSILPFITHKIKIPSFDIGDMEGKAESLNASIATSLICHEFRRRITTNKEVNS